MLQKEIYVKYLYYWLLPLIVFFQFCASGTKNTLSETESIQRSEVCLADNNHTYEIYLPQGKKECKEVPLLLIIDPKGSGKFALKPFIPIADKFKVALVSSNLIKNNFSGFPAAINLLLEDVANKYSIGEELFIAGFSGGARMALTYSQYYPSNGVILAGALAPPELLATVKCPVYALSGMADFNFIEAAQYLYRPDQAPSNLLMEFIDDSHQWPKTEELQNALGYMYLDQTTVRDECHDYEDIINDYLNHQVNRLQNLLKDKDYIAVYLLSQNLAHSSLFHSNPKLLSFYQSANYDADLNNQMNDLKESIRFELESRQTYYEALYSQSKNWWIAEIDKLNLRIGSSSEEFEKLALQRIKAFLGITCYSLTSNALSSNDFEHAERLLQIYAHLEPKNPDMLYFSAVYAKNTGNIENSRSQMRKAIDAGFSDRSLIDNF